MLTKQKKPAAIVAERPALSSIEPYAALSRRWADLVHREDELMAELRPLVSAIRAAGGYTERGGVPVRPAEPASDYRPGLKELVADVLPFRPREPAPLSELERQKTKAAKISAELDDIAAAKKTLLGPLNKARAEASATICAVAKADYAVIAQRIAAALTELGEAWTAHLGFLRELECESVSTSTLPRMVIRDLEDPLATVGRALQWGAECKYIDLSEVPVEWVNR